MKDASGEEHGQDSQVPGSGKRTGESQSRPEDSQFVGEELVPASQALVVKEQGESGKKGKSRDTALLRLQRTPWPNHLPTEQRFKGSLDSRSWKTWISPKRFIPQLSHLSVLDHFSHQNRSVSGRSHGNPMSAGPMPVPGFPIQVCQWWGGDFATPRFQMQRDMEQIGIMLGATQ